MMRAFICHSSTDDEGRLLILRGFKKEGIEGYFPFGDVKEIPRGYDGYLLHLSDIDETDLKELREEQVWSWIYCISGCSIWDIPDEIRRNFDGFTTPLTIEDKLSSFVNELNNHRVPS